MSVQSPCKHLKTCNAMLKFQNERGKNAGDVTWKYCETCPLLKREIVPEFPKNRQGFREKTIEK